MQKFIAVLLMLAAFFVSKADNWPQWRGPFWNGSSAEHNLPSDWSKTENVAWSLPLPGPGAATPVIWEDHVLLSSTDSQNQSLLALAVDRKSGKVLWQHKISDGLRRDNRSTFASPSPVTDGRRVIFFYSTGDLAAFDFTGQKLWARNIQTDYGTFAFLWTFSSSPLLYEGKLYLQVLQRDIPVDGRGRQDGPNDSYLLAMDPATGKTLWRQVRPSAAVGESREAFTTPGHWFTKAVRKCFSSAAIASPAMIRPAARSFGDGKPGIPLASGIGDWCHRPWLATALSWRRPLKERPSMPLRLAGPACCTMKPWPGRVTHNAR